MRELGQFSAYTPFKLEEYDGSLYGNRPCSCDSQGAFSSMSRRKLIHPMKESWAAIVDVRFLSTKSEKNTESTKTRSELLSLLVNNGQQLHSPVAIAQHVPLVTAHDNVHCNRH